MAVNVLASLELNSLLLRYDCIFNVSYCISLTFVCVFRIVFKFSNATLVARVLSFYFVIFADVASSYDIPSINISFLTRMTKSPLVGCIF